MEGSWRVEVEIMDQQLVGVAETSGASDNTDKQPPLLGLFSDSAARVVLIGE